MKLKVAILVVGLVAIFATLGWTASVFELAPGLRTFFDSDLAILVVTVLGGGAAAFTSILVQKESERQRKFVEESREALQSQETKIAEESKGSPTDFAALWAVTQQRIDYYHQIATNQSRKSFLSSQIATAMGFILIIIFGIIASRAQTPAAAISAGAIGVVGSGLSGYIAATFMKAQADATAQLRQFFMQPVEFTRMLGAERLLEGIKDEKYRAEQMGWVARSAMMTTREPFGSPPAFGKDEPKP